MSEPTITDDGAPTIAVLATLDTKGPEAAYLRDGLRARGLRAMVIDCGILEPPLDISPEVSSGQVASHGGGDIAALRAAGTRGAAVAAMRGYLADFLADRYAAGEIQGAIGIGGAEGAVMTAGALMRLPLGVPKVVISPIASGRHEFGPLVGTKDMMVVHSVVDILGLNAIAKTVFDNVVAAVAGMVATGPGRMVPEPTVGGIVALTMLGNTTKAVMAAKAELEDAGFEGVVFHSNGVGGPAMEEIAREGLFAGVIDFTTNEVNDPLVGGIHDGGPDRLRVIGQLGLPQVVVPGCVDFSVWEPSQIPPALRDRPRYDHNPEFALVRTSHDEMAQIAEIFGERLGEATAPVEVVVPTQGLSIPNVPDGPFWDPEGDARFVEQLRDALPHRIPLHTYDHHVNDPEFGRVVARHFIKLAQEENTQ